MLVILSPATLKFTRNSVAFAVRYRTTKTEQVATIRDDNWQRRIGIPEVCNGVRIDDDCSPEILLVITNELTSFCGIYSYPYGMAKTKIKLLLWCKILSGCSASVYSNGAVMKKTQKAHQKQE